MTESCWTRTLLLALGLLTASVPVALAAPDMILVNGKVVTADAAGREAQALAVENGRISALGSSADIKAMAGEGTVTVDLDGRTVIPGLIDSHIHAIRGALTFGSELLWTEQADMASALALIREAAQSTPKGEWITVVGGWHMAQFPENRLPTPQELAEAAPEHPVYVQHLYSEAVLNPLGIATLGITGDKDVPPKGRVELDAAGKPTGLIHGNVPTFARLYGLLPQPSLKQRKTFTRAFLTELNRLGMTGLVDAGGGGMFWKHYEAVSAVAADGDLTLRVRYRQMPQPPHAGKEPQVIKEFPANAAGAPETDMFRWAGFGEVIVWGMHDGDSTGTKFTAKPEARDALRQAASWIASQGLPLEIHASSDASARQILDIFEEIDKERDISGWRWVIAHIDDASEETLARMKALGLAWSVQNRLYYAGGEVLTRIGAGRMKNAPPINTGLKLGLPMGAGTDAHRVSPYSPMRSLQWLLDGRDVAGRPLRDPEQIPTRLDALRLYTINNAWMTFEEDQRGSIEPGKLADIAVLSSDIMTVPVDRIHEIESLLTLVGGKPVHAAGPYAALRR